MSEISEYSGHSVCIHDDRPITYVSTRSQGLWRHDDDGDWCCGHDVRDCNGERCQASPPASYWPHHQMEANGHE